jgi:hypothetical protein
MKKAGMHCQWRKVSDDQPGQLVQIHGFNAGDARHAALEQQYAFLHTPIFIPWSLLDYNSAKFPMTKWMRFDIRTAKVLFFVPREIAMAQLRQIGR